MSDIDQKGNDGITNKTVITMNSRVFNARIMKINQMSKTQVYKNKYLNIGNEGYTKLTRILKISINGLCINHERCKISRI